jgi:hypothetical protein
VFKPVRDIIGSILSGLCIVHCIASAALLALGGTGLVSLAAAPSDLHLLFIVPVFIIAAISFPIAKKRHGQDGPLKIAAVGLFLLAVALLMEVIWHLHILEIILTAIGGSALVYAHLQNRKLSQKASAASCS